MELPSTPRGLRAVLLPAIVCLAPSFAMAGEGASGLARLGTLTEQATRAGHPSGYVTLREIWKEWEQRDPEEVEAALLALSTSKALPAPERAYAGLLEAYARRRRGDLAGAQARVKNLGFVGRWLGVGPFDNEGKTGLERAFGPEEDQKEPLAVGKTYEGKLRAVRWRTIPESGAYGYVDAGAWARPSEKSCVYATTFVRSTKKDDDKARPLSVWVGANAAVKVFWNGVEVVKDDKLRAYDADRLAAGVVLRPGPNRVLVKVCGESEALLFSLRLAEPDGSPAADVTATNDLASANKAAALRFKKGDALGTKAPIVEGPIQAFERRAQGGSPDELERYARYLVLTHGDDPSERKARDLATRAATKAPTVDRLLLARELSEDRNQEAEWIEKAEARIAKGASDAERVKVWAARAAWLRAGANPREAMPVYEKVLALDPTHLQATLGRVDMYAEAGLKETALGVAEAALRVRPRSVALLGAVVTALRDLDRTAEADAVQERYSAFHFDDTSYLKDRLDLALARRDRDGALRWLERLQATNPDSTLLQALAGRVYASLGERSRAVASYKRALDYAPDDVELLTALATTYALGGQVTEQRALLRRVLELRPQDKDVREYLAHTEVQKPKPDEAYTLPAGEFLKLRDTPALGRARRTLVDQQVTTVFPNGLASRYHQVVFQPLTEAAATQGREYAFGYEADSEQVQMRGARVYRKDGKIEEAIETGEGNANDPSIAMYTSQRVFYVRFPRLYPGDVVELLYRVEDVAPHNAYADYFGEVVYLQSAEPVMRAEYTLITPKTRTFYFNAPRVPGLTKTEEVKGDDRIYRFSAKSVPPIEPEAGQPPLAEIAGHVHVSTYKSWDEMGQWYWGFVKDQFVADDEVRRRVADITKGLTDPRAKVRAIYGYVVQKTRYVALEFGIHGYKPYRCAQIFARGFGDCKDKATLIVTMLKEAGIPATIVIVRTGMRGDFEAEPASLAPFDHAIAYVPSMDLFLDGTAEDTGSTELPAMDRGSLALLVNEGKPKLVHMPDAPASASVSTRTLDVTLSPEGGADLRFRAEVTGVSAPSWRMRYQSKDTFTTRVGEDLASDYPGFELLKAETSDLSDIESHPILSGRGRVASFAKRDGDAFRVPVGPREHVTAEHAGLASRTSALRVGPRTTQDADWTLHLPPGARVKDLPRAAKGASRFGSYDVTVDTPTPTTVHVRTVVALDVSRVLVPDYPAFRAFAEEIDRALGQRLTYEVKR